MALPRPLLMSIPECPPLKPNILSLYNSPSFFSLLRGTLISESAPPAQPIVKTPSSSLSKFKSFFPFKKPGSILVAVFHNG